jgi:hypothetical protein
MGVTQVRTIKTDYRETASKDIVYKIEKKWFRVYSRGTSNNFYRDRVLMFGEITGVGR